MNPLSHPADALPPALGVGIIGNGMATRVFHAPYVGATPGLALRAVVARSGGASPVPGVPLLTDTAALLADPAIALVVIATPSATHAPLARACLLAGKHVVVEKPFALSLAEAHDLVALAAARGLQLAAFHNRRRDSDFLAVRAAIEAGLIGPVVHFESHYDRFRPQVRQRWREAGGPGSGVWCDLGPHLVDQAVVLFGAPQAVSAEICALRPGSPADDWAHVLLHYADKKVVLHASLCAAGGAARFVAHGLAGSLVKSSADRQEAQSVAGLAPTHPDWGHDPDPLRHIDAEGREHLLPAPRGDQPGFYAAMAAACRGQGPAPTAPGEILLVQAILNAAQASAQQGARLPLTDTSIP